MVKMCTRGLAVIGVAILIAVAVECSSPPSGSKGPGCSLCPSGTRVHHPCTQFTDTQCQPCPHGSFTDTDNQLTICKTCTKCPPRTYLDVPCTSTSDAVCAPCSEVPRKFSGSTCPEILVQGHDAGAGLAGRDVMMGDDPSLAVEEGGEKSVEGDVADVAGDENKKEIGDPAEEGDLTTKKGTTQDEINKEKDPAATDKNDATEQMEPKENDDEGDGGGKDSEAVDGTDKGEADKENIDDNLDADGNPIVQIEEPDYSEIDVATIIVDGVDEKKDGATDKPGDEKEEMPHETTDQILIKPEVTSQAHGEDGDTQSVEDRGVLNPLAENDQGDTSSPSTGMDGVQQGGGTGDSNGSDMPGDVAEAGEVDVDDDTDDEEGEIDELEDEVQEDEAEAVAIQIQDKEDDDGDDDTDHGKIDVDEEKDEEEEEEEEPVLGRVLSEETKTEKDVVDDNEHGKRDDSVAVSEMNLPDTELAIATTTAAPLTTKALEESAQHTTGASAEALTTPHQQPKESVKEEGDVEKEEQKEKDDKEASEGKFDSVKTDLAEDEEEVENVQTTQTPFLSASEGEGSDMGDEEEEVAEDLDDDGSEMVEVVVIDPTTSATTAGEIVLTLEEAEAKYAAQHPEGEEEPEIDTDDHDEHDASHKGDDGHGHEHGGPDHVGKVHHGDTEEDIESKKRTAIIVGVAVGGVALFTLAFFTSRQCRRHGQFKEMKKVDTNGDPEALEFRPLDQSGTVVYEEPDSLATNGLYRQGPKIGPPSPRIHRREGEKFAFPDIYSVPDKEKKTTPLLSTEAGQIESDSSPTHEPLTNGVEKQLKYIDDSTDDEYVATIRERLLPSRSHDPRLSNVVEETPPTSPFTQELPLPKIPSNQSQNGGTGGRASNPAPASVSSDGSVGKDAVNKPDKSLDARQNGGQLIHNN